MTRTPTYRRAIMTRTPTNILVSALELPFCCLSIHHLWTLFVHPSSFDTHTHVHTLLHTPHVSSSSHVSSSYSTHIPYSTHHTHTHVRIHHTQHAHARTDHTPHTSRIPVAYQSYHTPQTPNAQTTHATTSLRPPHPAHISL